MTGNQHHEDPARLPGEGDVRLLPIAPSDEEIQRKADKTADDACKLRQLGIDEQQVAVAESNRNLTFALAVFTFFGVIAGGIQACISQKGVDAAKASARAAQQAANAACINAKLAQEGETDSHNLAVGSIQQAHAVTRAEASQIKISRFPRVKYEPGQPITFPVEITNIGKSAAIDIRIRAEAVFSKTGKEPSFIFTKRSSADATGFIYPDEQAASFIFYMKDSSGSHIVSTQDQRADIVAGREYLSIFEKLTYRDIFGIRHWNSFCLHAPDSLDATAFQKCRAYDQIDQVTTQNVSSLPLTKSNPIDCKVPKG